MTHQQILVDQADNLHSRLSDLTVAAVLDPSVSISDVQRLARISQRAHARFTRRINLSIASTKAAINSSISSVIASAVEREAFQEPEEHCLACRITYQPKSGDSARLPAGAPVYAFASASSRAGRQFIIQQPWKKSCSYGVRWNRRNFYKARSLSRFFSRYVPDFSFPNLVDAYFELMRNLANYDRLADRRPCRVLDFLDIPF